MQTLRKFLSKKRTGLLLIAAVVLFVVGWRLVAMARQPSNIFKIANEIGSVAQTREGVYPNRSGTSVVFYQETETGLGTYLHVIQTGKTHLLYKQPEKGYGEQYRRIGCPLHQLSTLNHQLV